MSLNVISRTAIILATSFWTFCVQATVLGAVFSSDGHNDSAQICKLKSDGAKSLRLWVDTAHNANCATVATKAAIFTQFKQDNPGAIVTIALNPGGTFVQPTYESAQTAMKILLGDKVNGVACSDQLKKLVDVWEIGNEVPGGAYWGTKAKVAGCESLKVPGSSGLNACDPLWGKVDDYVTNYFMPIANFLSASGLGSKVSTYGINWPAGGMSPMNQIAWLTFRGVLNSDISKSRAKWVALHLYNESTGDIANVKNAIPGVKTIVTEWSDSWGSGRNYSSWVVGNSKMFASMIRQNADVLQYYLSAEKGSEQIFSGAAKSYSGAGHLYDLSGSEYVDHGNYAVEFANETQTLGQHPFQTGYSSDDAYYEQCMGKPSIGSVRVVYSNSGATVVGFENLSSGQGIDLQTFPDANISFVADTRNADQVTYSLNGTALASAGVNLNSAPTSSTLSITATRGSAKTTRVIPFTLKVAEVGNSPAGRPAASITGLLFNDGNSNSRRDTSDTATGIRTVFLDSNKNGRIDTGEVTTSSDSLGVYRFSNLRAGTYYVSRVFPAGYRMSNSSAGYITVIISEGEAVSGVDIGTTNK